MDVESVEEEVLPETSGSNFFFEVPVCGGDYPGDYFDRSVSPDSRYFILFQHPK